MRYPNAWLGGIVSYAGMLSLVKNHGVWVVQYTLRDSVRGDILVMAAEIMSATTRPKGKTRIIQIMGSKVEEVYQQLYPFLSQSRHLEYRSLRVERDRRNAEITRITAAASTPPPSNDDRRRKREALYSSEDPAVVMVEDHFTPDMVSDIDLMTAAATRAREKAERDVMLAGHSLTPHTKPQRKRSEA